MSVNICYLFILMTYAITDVIIIVSIKMARLEKNPHDLLCSTLTNIDTFT